MKSIKFRPLRYVKKSKKIVVASYAQWKNIKSYDYGCMPFELILNTDFRYMDANSYVYNHKGENLFWHDINIESIITVETNDDYQKKYWKTCTGYYSVSGLDCDGVPVFTNGTTLNISNLRDLNEIDKYEPLDVKTVVKWLWWFIYELKNCNVIKK